MQQLQNMAKSMIITRIQRKTRIKSYETNSPFFTSHASDKHNPKLCPEATKKRTNQAFSLFDYHITSQQHIHWKAYIYITLRTDLTLMKAVQLSSKNRSIPSQITLLYTWLTYFSSTLTGNIFFDIISHTVWNLSSCILGREIGNTIMPTAMLKVHFPCDVRRSNELPSFAFKWGNRQAEPC